MKRWNAPNLTKDGPGPTSRGSPVLRRPDHPRNGPPLDDRYALSLCGAYGQLGSWGVGDEDAERVARQVGIDPQRLIGIGRAVLEQAGTQSNGPGVLSI